MLAVTTNPKTFPSANTFFPRFLNAKWICRHCPAHGSFDSEDKTSMEDEENDPADVEMGMQKRSILVYRTDCELEWRR